MRVFGFSLTFATVVDPTITVNRKSNKPSGFILRHVSKKMARDPLQDRVKSRRDPVFENKNSFPHCLLGVM